ncbi:Bromodomain containing protein [Trema orientale]|uniref:Bromodomain containing protein n=1 Tax=Trema orientale TaxID=63057 RepID=A0A2P5FBW4_TREOI|nr:Bromodomain containing protein [Trema orientale]
MMVTKANGFPGKYYGNAIRAADESEGSGSSGRIDMEIAASVDSSALTRKCLSLNSNKGGSFCIPKQVLPLSSMLPSERKDLVHRLRMELGRIRGLQKKVELQKGNGVAMSSSSDILSCSNGHNGAQIENFQKSSVLTSGQGKISKTGGKRARASGKFDSANQTAAPSTTTVMLMKQCETLLGRLMSHQYGWVFNNPVDAVKLNIPDYYTVIKHPMDLGTVKRKIASGSYSNPMEFFADVRLTFTNAMTYNPPGNDVHIMADTLNKFFEVRWKAIEKKLPKLDSQPLPEKSGSGYDLEMAKPIAPSKKRKIISTQPEVRPEPQPAKRVMTEEERHNMGRELESLLSEMPLHIIDFLRENSSNGKDSVEDEIEIDIDELSDDTLFTLRKLLDEYLEKKQKNQSQAEPCEIELLHDSGLSNSSMQPCKGDAPQSGNDQTDDDVDIGGNEPPVSSYPPLEIEKDTGHRISKSISSDSSSDSESSCPSDDECDGAKASTLVDASKVPEALDSGAELDQKTTISDLNERNQTDSGLDQVEQPSEQKPGSVESDSRQDADSAPSGRQVSPEKQYRAAVLKNRFADTILRAREKTLNEGDKGDPEKLRREREELELQRRKEKARLQAEAKAAEDARRRAEEEAAAEAKRKRELEREAARQALLKIEKTVEINENSRFLEDLEMLRTAPAEQLPSSVDETSPDHSQDGLGGFKFGGSNALEQLGLFMKEDEDEEEGEPPCVPNTVDNIEEGEID